MSKKLLSPLNIGPWQLAHRVVMAPLTRMRATVPGSAPNAMNAEYYGQRASQGGLIICEASPISAQATVGPRVPGIWTADQIGGWKRITDAIHAKGGIAVLQLWHIGRVAHTSNRGGNPPVAPSAVAINGNTLNAKGETVPFETPRALETSEVAAVVADFAQAAQNAMAAGFDGVEIHAANGYLLEEFLQSRTNQRTDQYGGSIENRARLVLDVARAIAAAVGANRTGIRLSPYGRANDSGEADPMPLYAYVTGELNKLGLAYLHLIEPRASGAGQREVDHQDVPSAAVLFRPHWQGALIAAGNFKADTAEAMIAEGHADAIAFGRYFISNPDLPERIRRGAAFTAYNRATFYSSGPAGYIDYTPLEHA